MNDSQDARLNNTLGALIVGLSDEIRDATDEAAGQTAAGPAALVALSDLLAGGTVDELRRSVDLTPSGGVRLVDRLEKDGLVVRGAGADNRSLALTLTTRGRAAANKVGRARAAVVEDALDALEPSERSELVRLVDKLIGQVVAGRLSARASGMKPGGGWLCRLCDTVACGRDSGSCPAEQATRRLRDQTEST